MKTKTQNSTTKFKLMLGLVIVLLMGLLVANWTVGNIMEEKLAQNLDKSLENTAPNFSLNYEQLVVNPMLAEVTFKNTALKYEDAEAFIDFNWDKSVYKASYADLFNLVYNQADTIDQLHSLKTDFNNVKISGELKGKKPFDFIFSFAKVGLDFDGTLSKKELSNNPEQILTHNQNLKVAISDFEMDSPKFFNKILINSNVQEKLLNLDQLNLNLDYKADDKIVKVKETINSSHSKGELMGDIKLLGKDMNNIKGMKLDLESKGQFEVTNLKWGQAEKTGQYSIDKLSGNSEFEIDREVIFSDYVQKENMILGESESEIDLENLKIQFAGALKNRLFSNPIVMLSGINTNEIIVDNINLDYQTKNRQVRIEKGKLNSSVVDADFTADLKLNNQYPNLSRINNSNIKLSDFKGNLRRLFEGFESRMGLSFPREGDAIVLEIKGTFAQPRIKGIHY